MVDLTSPGHVRTVAIALAVVCLVAVGAAGSTSAAVFDPFNVGWNGTSSMWVGLNANGADIDAASAPGRYRDLPTEGTAVLVLSPPDRYEQPTIDALRSFVWRGGTLVVAEDFGQHGNHVLTGVGATARFDGAPLHDGVADTPARPVVPAGPGQDLRLNRPTAVHPGDGRVLVSTSSFSYLDTDQDGALDADEPLGRHAVVVAEPVGSGRVVAVGDPSVFINGMLGEADNRAYALGLLGGYDRVVYSSPPGRPLPPMAMAYLTARQSSIVQFGIGIAGLAVIGVLRRTRRSDQRGGREGSANRNTDTARNQTERGR